MTICPKCNTPVEDGHAFCFACGESMPQPVAEKDKRVCPSCLAEIGDDHAFCPFCGTKVEVEEKHFCLNCNAELDDNHAFCPFCGTKKGAPRIPEAAAANTDDTQMYSCPVCNSVVKPYHGLCPFCATELSGLPPVTMAPPRPQPKVQSQEAAGQYQRRKLHCPMCKSNNLSVVTESNISTGITTSRGNISGTVFSNEHKQFWMCHDCGTKFRNIQSLEEEIHGERFIPNIFKFMFYLCLVATILFMLVGVFTQSEVFVVVIAFTVIAGILMMIFWTVFDGRIREKEEELERLKSECFD